MLTIDRHVTPELLEIAFQQVDNDLKSAQLRDPGVERVCNLTKSPHLRMWAFECASALWSVKEIPEEVALTVLGLITAGMLIGMEVQKAASEIDALEKMCDARCSPERAKGC